MTQIEVFQFPATGQEIRMLIRNDEPLFCHVDVCTGLKHSNPSVAIKLVDDEDRVQIDLTEMDISNLKRTPINPKMWFLTESGFYALALASQAPGVRPFRRWVTHEVLPTIRKTGRYDIAPAKHALPQTYAEALRELASTVEERDAAKAELAIAGPKAEYVDAYVGPDDACTIRVFANQLQVGEKALRAWLVDRKLIYRKDLSRWSGSKQRTVTEYLYQPYADRKTWFRIGDQPNAPRLHNDQLRTTLYVTPIGKVGIQRLLARHPIPAAIEGAA